LATFGVGQILCTGKFYRQCLKSEAQLTFDCCRIALAALAVNHLASPIRVLFGSLICLMGAILFYGVANSPWLIISARFAQGASNAIINTVGLMILVDRLGPENYGKSFGYIGMATAIGCVLGPVFGGVLHDLSGYEAMFMITAGLVGFCALLVMLTHDVSKYAIERNSSPCSEETPRSPETDRERPLLGSTEPERWPISQLLLGLLGLVLSSLFPASLDTVSRPIMMSIQRRIPMVI
jgi:MFS family permease